MKKMQMLVLLIAAGAVWSSMAEARMPGRVEVTAWCSPTLTIQYGATEMYLGFGSDVQMRMTDDAAGDPVVATGDWGEWTGGGVFQGNSYFLGSLYSAGEAIPGWSMELLVLDEANLIMAVGSPDGEYAFAQYATYYNPCAEEKSCCDLCLESEQASGQNPGGRVCCCKADGGAGLEKEACSFADKYPDPWPPGPGQDILDKCIMVHEQGHIDQGEGNCDGKKHGEGTDYKPGVDPAEVEADNIQDEIDCLNENKDDCPEGDTQCTKMIEDRIEALGGGCAHSCVSQ